MPDFGKILETFITVTVPILIYIWTSRRETKKETDAVHQKNLELWNEILNERKNFPAHEHWERNGPLNAEGIRRSPGWR